MRVRIDEAREDVFPGRVDHRGARWRGQVRADGGDGLALAPHVGVEVGVGGDDAAVFDEEAHNFSRSSLNRP